MVKGLGISHLRYGPSAVQSPSGAGTLRLVVCRGDFLRPARPEYLRRSPICVTSAYRIGSAISRTRTGRLICRIRPRFRAAFPLGALLYARQRDIRCGHVLGAVRLVERVPERRPSVRQGSQPSMPGQCASHARDSRGSPGRHLSFKASRRNTSMPSIPNACTSPMYSTSGAFSRSTSRMASPSTS